MHRIKWSDLEFVLAVAREGSAAGAARLLGVNHATVIRRIQNFESQWDEPIFEHRRDGYRITKAGETFLEAAQSIDGILDQLKRKAESGHTALSGHVRLTSTDSLFPILSKKIPALRKAYPDITLDILMTNRRLDLFNRDADIALRASDLPPDNLIGRRIGHLTFGIYTPFAFQDEKEVKDRPWLGLEEPLASSRFGQTYIKFISNMKTVARADSFIGLKHLAENEVGSVFLPDYLAQGLQRVFEKEVSLSSDLWLLTHPDIVRAQRVRACMDFLYEALAESFKP